uniref:CCHC-type domain-containing protein n=1 Tax=Felis catus TaxID=9685 RepID=A0ABI7ZV80_FELCA
MESPQKLALSFASMELEDFLGALCLSVFVFLCFALWTYWTDVMGQTQTTPLSIMIDHFKDVRGRANNLSVEVRKGRLQFFCSSEWPTFNVGWPPEGTFDLPTIHRVRSIISQPKTGHLDQLPYIITWQDLVEDPPSWLKPFLTLLPPEPKPILALQETEKRKRLTQPSAPLYPVLQGGTEEELIFPPPYNPSRMPEEHHPPPPGEADAVPRAGGGNAPGGSPPFTTQRAQREQSASAADSTILPLRATGPPDAEGNWPHHYWPFATSDLYNWKAQNPTFSEKPAGLIDLLDSVLFTHQPTWDNCQQLLQVLFTTEERERILNEARKLVPGADGNPTTNQAQIEASFPLTRPQWDFNTAEGKERLRVYRQTLMGGLQMAARKPTNLAKVGNVQQGKDESPAAFLERIMEAFRTYTPMDPEAPESKAAVILAFVNQSAVDIRRKLQKIDRLGEKSLQDLLVVAEKAYNNREPPEDKQARAVAAASSKQTRDLARILLATTADSPKERDRRLRQLADDARKGKGTTKRGKQRLQKDQCAYCKEIGHWARDCPKRAGGKGSKTDRVKVLELDELSD